jgi:hypothetical protein
MIVRHHRHARSPDDIKDCQIGRPVKDLDLRATRLADHLLDGIRVCDSPGDDFTDSLHSGGFTYGSAAVGLESIQIKHEDDLPDWLL